MEEMGLGVEVDRLQGKQAQQEGEGEAAKEAAAPAA